MMCRRVRLHGRRLSVGVVWWMHRRILAWMRPVLRGRRRGSCMRPRERRRHIDE